MPQLGPYNITAGQATRIRETVARERQLLDAQGQPRLATQQEADDWVWDMIRAHVKNRETVESLKVVAEPSDLGPRT